MQQKCIAIENMCKYIILWHGVHKNFKLKFQDISRTFQDKNSVFPGQFLAAENLNMSMCLEIHYNCFTCQQIKPNIFL